MQMISISCLSLIQSHNLPNKHLWDMIHCVSVITSVGIIYNFNHVSWMCPFFQLCLCVFWWPPHEAPRRRQQPSRLWGWRQGLSPHEETSLLKLNSACPLHWFFKCHSQLSSPNEHWTFVFSSLQHVILIHVEAGENILCFLLFSSKMFPLRSWTTNYRLTLKNYCNLHLLANCK